MVFVLDAKKKPLMPCSEKRARLLLERGRARVHRMAPFAIRLVDRTQETSVLQPIALKLDPGSKTTGIALVAQQNDRLTMLFLAELSHRGNAISEALTQRKGYRRRRRSVNLRYRKLRFDNRRKPAGWLPPSLRHRLQTIHSWVQRLRHLAPVATIAQELVRFDMQAVQRPGISGIEYQQGALAGYEVREYLLEKWGRTCAYCDAKNVPLQIDHVVAKAGGGSDRVSNLTLACEPCNKKKGAQSIDGFLAADPERLARIKAQLKSPLKDAAAVNATRWALLATLQAEGLPVDTASGGRTKFNRSRLGLPKTHGLDAACVGNLDAITQITTNTTTTLQIKACGRGAYQRTRVTEHGFPRGYLMRRKHVRGFSTGDRVRAIVPIGKKAGVHIGRVAVRASGSFNIQTAHGTIQGINANFCRLVQRGDGYSYHLRKDAPLLSGLNAGVGGVIF